jgi:nitric oxide synthase oxygenase domain/subunit
MDVLARHLAQTLDLMVKYLNQVGRSASFFRKMVDHLNEMHRRAGIPSWAFPIIGSQLIDTLKPFFQQEEKLTIDEPIPVTADELEVAYVSIYVELMVMVDHGMVWEEKLVAEAEDFFEQVADEHKWSTNQLNRRLLEVKMEIQATGTYTHTSEELQTGARLAWRNSSKCIGRIAWNTLLVRDCRHVESAHEIFKEVEEHLRLATCGTNIQSVMTVFKPKGVNEMWGTRFWSSQFVRYAGYKTRRVEKSWAIRPMSILLNVSYPLHLRNAIKNTSHSLLISFSLDLVKNEYWKPPEKRTRFDVLPLVLKIPGVSRPFVYMLPKELRHEVKIEHPDCPAIGAMGLRWAAVPAISNFNMNLGGVDYQCVPFNGWFASVEIGRNLFERYKLAEEWAKAAGINTKTKTIYEQRVYLEMDTAVNYSFKKQGFTMVDMETVGKSFIVHCGRERNLGRECPAQWSWIGGLTGPTNVTWHHEMRDFYVAPQ